MDVTTDLTPTGSLRNTSLPFLLPPSFPPFPFFWDIIFIIFGQDLSSATTTLLVDLLQILSVRDKFTLTNDDRHHRHHRRRRQGVEMEGPPMRSDREGPRQRVTFETHGDRDSYL